MSIELSTEAIRDIVALAAGTGKPVEHPAGGHAIIVPEGYNVQHLSPIDKPLTHIKQSVTFADADSFITYVEAFKDDTTRIFAHIEAGKIMAVIDYHGKGAAAYGAHRAIYALPFSEEWKRWTAIDGRAIDQRDFAEFIQENAVDVYQPDSASLLEVALNLQGTRKADFKSGVNLSNGTTQLIYQEEDDAKGGKQNLIIPQRIAIRIPVYYGDVLAEIEAFFRYRLDDGKLRFIVKMHRREMILQDAFRGKAAEISEATGIQVLFGMAS